MKLTAEQVLDKLASTIQELRQQAAPQKYGVKKQGCVIGVYTLDDDGQFKIVQSRFTTSGIKVLGLVANFYTWLPGAEEFARHLAEKLNKKELDTI